MWVFPRLCPLILLSTLRSSRRFLCFFCFLFFSSPCCCGMYVCHGSFVKMLVFFRVFLLPKESLFAAGWDIHTKIRILQMLSSIHVLSPKSWLPIWNVFVSSYLCSLDLLSGFFVFVVERSFLNYKDWTVLACLCLTICDGLLNLMFMIYAFILSRCLFVFHDTGDVSHTEFHWL